MTITACCRTCRQPFEYEPVSLPDDFFIKSIPTPSICDQCVKAEEEETAAVAKRSIQDAMRQEHAARNIPERYDGATFETFTPRTDSQTRALEAVRDHAKEGVYLLGRAGCGKTHLAAAAIHEAQQGSLFVATTELLDDIRAGYEGCGQGLYDRAKVAPLLALDDLGAEAVTDWVRDRLYTLLNERWNQCRPVIVTTNCTPKTIAERIGDGAASRLAGICRRRIEIEGPDMRRAAS